MKDDPGPALLLLSCSRRKSSRVTRGPAWDVYDGPLYQVLKKLLRGHPDWPSRLRILIVSARHGLLEPDQVIDTYDDRMTAARAGRCGDEWGSRLRELVVGRRFRAVHVNLGQDYLRALPGLAALLAPTPIEWASGGIGVRNAQTKGWVARQLTTPALRACESSPSPPGRRLG
jgi:hypothetical protein